MWGIACPPEFVKQDLALLYKLGQLPATYQPQKEFGQLLFRLSFLRSNVLLSSQLPLQKGLLRNNGHSNPNNQRLPRGSLDLCLFQEDSKKHSDLSGFFQSRPADSLPQGHQPALLSALSWTQSLSSRSTILHASVVIGSLLEGKQGNPEHLQFFMPFLVSTWMAILLELPGARWPNCKKCVPSKSHSAALRTQVHKRACYRREHFISISLDEAMYMLNPQDHFMTQVQLHPLQTRKMRVSS